HASLTRQHIDGSATGEEVLHHLPGHVLRVSREAGLRRAMIAGADKDARIAQLRGQGLLDQAKLQGQGFELPQRALRFGLVVYLRLQCGGQCLIHDACGARKSGFSHANLKGMIEFILGGARSGKSALAEQKAVASGLAVTYIATADAADLADDKEMRARIEHHRAQRPAEWLLVEEPRYLATLDRKSTRLNSSHVT